MNIYFIILAVIHILIWGFVLLAFLNKNLAKINIYFVIPFIYLVHIFPFHFLEKLKDKIYNKKEKEKHSNKIFEFLIIPKCFVDLQKYLDDFCTFSPISPQGMLIFGLLSSIFVLYPLKLKY